MNRLLTLALPVLALAACAPMGGYRGNPNAARDWDGPLDARLYGSGRQFQVQVNQPAYVAVFEIAPGRGLGLVYPRSGYEETQRVSRSQWINPYMRSGVTNWISSVGTPFYQDFAGPARFYMLIASKHPLNTEHFRRSPGSLRTSLGLHAYGGEREVLNALVERVLPPQPEEDWTTDVLPVWSDDSGRMDRRRLVRVTCPDGTVAVVPPEMVRYACRRQQQTPPPANDTARAPGHPKRPGGTRPRPGDPTTRPGAPAEGAAAAPANDGARRDPVRRTRQGTPIQAPRRPARQSEPSSRGASTSSERRTSGGEAPRAAPSERPTRPTETPQ